MKPYLVGTWEFHGLNIYPIFWRCGVQLAREGRHHYPKSANTDGGQIHHNFVTILISPCNSTDTKRGFARVKSFDMENSPVDDKPGSRHVAVMWPYHQPQL